MVYIIMDKLDITVAEFRDVVGNEYNDFIDARVRGLFSKLHSIGILHGDAHASNIMFNLTKAGKEAYRAYKEKTPVKPDKNGDFYGSLESLMFIDFGKSVDFKQEKILINDSIKKEDIGRFV
jgi:predicted unusual protein kinase regulating ubiquinone biosynthesis (AarF/ABC1/UbiB family)